VTRVADIEIETEIEIATETETVMVVAGTAEEKEARKEETVTELRRIPVETGTVKNAATATLRGAASASSAEPPDQCRRKHPRWTVSAC